MAQFIKLKSNAGYHLANGMEGCIVKVREIIGTLAVVPAPNLGLFCKPENKFLAGELNSIGKPNEYFFGSDHYELVDNPLSHWNDLKSGNLH